MEGKEVQKAQAVGAALAPVYQNTINIKDIVDRFEAYRTLIANLVKDEDYVYFVSYMVKDQRTAKLRQKMEAYPNKEAAEARARILAEKGFKPRITPRHLKSAVEKLFKAMNMISGGKYFLRWPAKENYDNAREYVKLKAEGKAAGIVWVRRVLVIGEAVLDAEGRFQLGKNGDVLMVEREKTEAWCTNVERSFAHVPHDIVALAETRAYNRAVMRLLGMGQTTAEEIGSMAGDAGAPVTITSDAVVMDGRGAEEPPVEATESEEPLPGVKKGSDEIETPQEPTGAAEAPVERVEGEKVAPKEEEAKKEAGKPTEGKKGEIDPKIRVQQFKDACKGRGFGGDRNIMQEIKAAIFRELGFNVALLITEIEPAKFNKAMEVLNKSTRESMLRLILKNVGVVLEDKEFEVWKSEVLKVIEVESFEAMSLPQLKKAIEIAKKTTPE